MTATTSIRNAERCVGSSMIRSMVETASETLGAPKTPHMALLVSIASRYHHAAVDQNAAQQQPRQHLASTAGASIEDGLDLLLNPKRLVASLRR